MPDKSKDLEPVSDLKMIQRYLKYGVEFRELATCLVEDIGFQFDAYLKIADEKNLHIELEITDENFRSVTPEKLASLDRPQGDIRFSYSVNEATFFVHGRIQGRRNNRLRIAASMPMYKLQRREALRIKVMDSHNASIQLGPDLKHSLFDISAGGISVIVSLEKQADYKKDMNFPNSTLHFLGKEIKVNLMVQNILQHGKDGLKWKIGFKFVGLPASVEQMIAKEAYLHTHKIWSRWL